MDFEAHCVEIEKNLAKVELQLSDTSVLSNPEKLKETAQRHRALERIVNKWHELQQAYRAQSDAREMLTDPEMTEMAEDELLGLETQIPTLENDLQVLLLPPDPLDEKNIVMEIRAGTGGEEAALFAGDLFRLYSRYAENRGWKQKIISANATELGGFKEVIFTISGASVYSRMKFESGTHRVQRVPATETQGRIHTSAITVAVMPEASEIDIKIKTEDVRVDVFRSSGPGGQSVNTTDSAVRLTHIPTNLTVSMQDEKSQIKNKAKAFQVLRARLLELEVRKQQEKEAATRKAQIGTGDRSGRIRTYNYPQNRCSDHRISLTLYKLEIIMNGDLDLLTEPLMLNEQIQKMEQAAEKTVE